MPVPIAATRPKTSRKSIVRLLSDRFSTAHATITSPRTCEPGPGTLTTVDTETKFATAGGELTFAPRATPTGGDPRVYTTASYARALGRAFWVRWIQSGNTGDMRIGWSSANNAAPAIGFSPTSEFFAGVINSSASAGFTNTRYDLNGYYDLIVVFQTTGSLFFIHGGRYAKPTLVWVSNLTETNFTPGYGMAWTTNSTGRLSDEDVFDLPAPFNSQYGLVLASAATTTAGQTFVCSDNIWLEFTITAATGVTQEIMVRRTDDNNCQIIRMSQAGSTIALIEKVAGVETSRASAAQTWTNATQYRVIVTCDKTEIIAFVAGSRKWNYATAVTTLAGTGVKVSDIGANFYCYPRYVTFPAGYFPPFQKSLICDGDSLTLGTNATNEQQYPRQLTDLLYAANKWKDSRLVNLGVGGTTIVSLNGNAATNVDLLLGTDMGTNCVIIWAGTNDISANTRTGAQVYADLVTYAQARKAAGWSKVVTLTCLPRQSANGNFETERQNLNTLLRANAAAAFDAVADVGNDATIGQAGQQTNLTYYGADQIHPINAGYTIVAGYVQTALQSIGLA